MKMKNIIFGCLAGVLIIGVGGSVTLSALTFSEIRSMKNGTGLVLETEQDSATPTENLTSEDDVMIAEQYKIQSTLPISDAYKSGDTSKLSDQEKETLDLASKVLDEIITDGMSDYEKECAVYDWMAKEISNDSGMLTVVPTTSQDSATPYGALKYHNAVCVGYATTFRLFMQMMDIECKVIHNTDLYHSWDLVKLDDHWYHVDVYSDAGVGNYANFNLNDTIQSAQQEWDREYFPVSDSLDYNYAYQNRVSAKSIYDIPKLLRKALDDQISSLIICFEDPVSEEEMQKGSTIVSYIDELMLYNDTQQLGYLQNYTWIKEPSTDNNLYWITANVNTGGIQQSAYTQDEIDKMQKAITDAFEDIGSVDLNGALENGGGWETEDVTEADAGMPESESEVDDAKD